VVYIIYQDSNRPIQFISRNFSSAEKNYATIEKELLAIIF